jgi:hypothetical protein
LSIMYVQSIYWRSTLYVPKFRPSAISGMRLRRTDGEQNIVWNTDMYIQTAYGQQIKRVRRSPGGKTGLDKV